MAGNGNGSTGRMLDLMGHAITRLDDLVTGQRETNSRLDGVIAEQRETNRRLDSMEQRQDRMEKRQDEMATDLAEVKTDVAVLKTDVADLKLHASGMEDELHGVNRRLDSSLLADRHMRDRLGALERWAATKGYEGPPESAAG